MKEQVQVGGGFIVERNDPWAKYLYVCCYDHFRGFLTEGGALKHQQENPRHPIVQISWNVKR